MISIVIPTLNRSHVLEGIIQSYLMQPEMSEIIIVDDGSTDEHIKKLKEIASRDSRIVLHLNHTNLGTPKTRNIGASLASSEYIFYGEDDLFLPQNHLKTLLEHMGSTKSDLISGRRIWMNKGEDYDSAFLRANNTGARQSNNFLALTNCEAITRVDISTYMLDASILTKTEIVRRIKFDETNSKTYFWREETDFQISCAEHGLKLTFCPHTASFHLPRETDRGGSRNRSNYDYQKQIILNNWYFLNKHRVFLETKMGMGSIYLSFIAFVFDRIWTKNLFPALVRFKKSIF